MNEMKENKRQKGVFLTGDYVNLTVLSEEDIHNSSWYDWFNDEETTQFMQQHYFPNTKEKQIEFLNALNNDSSKIQLGIKDKEKNGPIIGVVSLNAIDLLNRKTEISLIIGEKEYRNVSYSIDVFRLIVNHAFNTLNLNKVWAGTLIKEWVNLVVRVLNFRQEGVLRKDTFKNGEYRDVYLYSALKEEWNG